MRNLTKSVVLPLIVLVTAMLAVIPLLAVASDSQTGTQTPTTLWRKMYVSNGAYDAIQTSDGGYAIISPGGDGCLLVKFDSEGNVEWSKSHGHPVYGVYPESVVQTSDGGYAVAGLAQSINGSVGHVWLFKTDSYGALLGNKILGDDKGYQDARCLIQTSDGGFAITGDYGGYDGYDGPNGWNFLLMKTDPDGNLQWTKIIGKRDDDRATSIIQTRDGGYALTGCTSVPGNSPMFWLVKTNSAGNMQWNQSYPETHGGWSYDLTQTFDGGYALVGTAGGWSGSTGSICLVKTDSAGNKQWLQSIGETMEFATSVIQTSDGGYAVSGGRDFQLAKIDAFGNLQWNYSDSNGPVINGTLACTVIQTKDGNYFLAGKDYSWIAKISDGTVSAETSPTPQPTKAPATNETTIHLTCQSSVSTNIRVNIKGSLTSAGVGISNASILLSYSIDTGTHWNEFTAVNTDDNGVFNVLWTPQATGNYLINATWLGSNHTVTTVTSLAIAPCDSQSLFSVTSNSTLSGLSFDSASKQLSFSVSGPTGTTGYFDINIPKTLISDVSGLQVNLDGTAVHYDLQSQGDSWLVSFAYHHSSHHVTVNLNSQQTAQTSEFFNPWIAVLVIGGMAAIVVVVVLVAKRTIANR
ncbi:MAG: hypothetical protein ACQCN6_08320 [Candidatus Bathyarchaeia archaeon]|jgi:hypothetical protein